MTIKMKSRKERQEALRARIRDNAKKRGKNSGGNRGILDLSSSESPKFFKPKANRSYLIDIIPWIVQTKNHPQGIEPGEEDYILDVWVHGWIGVSNSTLVCLERTFNKPCPICEERKTLMQDENTPKGIISKLSPQRRALYNIIDLNNEDAGIQIFDATYSQFEVELLEEADRPDLNSKEARTEPIIFADLIEGKSIKFRTSEKTFYVSGDSKPKTYITYKSFDFVDRDPIDEEVLKESYAFDKLLIIPSYDEVNKIFHGVELEHDENESDKKEVDEEKEESPKKEEKPSCKADDQNDEFVSSNLDEMNKRQLRQYIKKNNIDIKVSLKMTEDEIRDLIRTNEKGGKSNPSELSCPCGYKFGIDVDSYEDCMDCNIYEKCADKAENG